MKTTFSFQRYWLLIKKYYAEHYIMQILIFVLTLLIFTGVRSFASLSPAYIQANDIDRITLATIIQYALMFYFGLIIFAYQTAHSMPFMDNRLKHISYIMLPATAGEKFASVFTISYVIPLCYMTLAAVLSNAFQYIYTHTWMRLEFSNEFINAIYNTAPEIPWNPDTTITTAIIGLIAFVFMIGGWFTISATLFHKHPFLIGSIIYYIISRIFQIISFFLLFGSFNTFYNNVDTGIYISTLHKYIWIGITIFFLVGIACYILAFRRMRKTQI